MSRPNNLIRRKGIYYARIYVSSDLWDQMNGRKQIWRSLRTSDFNEAKRRLSVEVDQWALTFDDMRRGRELSDDAIGLAVWERYSEGLAAGDRERDGRPTQLDIDKALDKAFADARRSGAADAGPLAMINAMTDVEILVGKADWAERRRAARLNRLRSDLGSGDTRLIEPDVDAFLGAKGFRTPKGTEKYRELCQKFMRADIEMLQRYAEHDRGDFTGKAADPIIVEPVFQPASGEGDGSVMQLLDKYERENPNDVRPETFKQIRSAVQHFADFLGPRVPVGAIDKRHVREWKEVLAEWPVKATEIAAFQGLGIRATVEANRQLNAPKPCISRPTIRRYMGNLSGFCRWLVTNDYLKFNPVEGMLPRKTGPVNRRTTFTDDALEKLFTSPLFTACEGEHWRQADRPGSVHIRDHRYWIPLVMAHSGARPGEIAQLDVADVQQQHGIWFMHIREGEDSNKRTKTKGSVRVVPIHSQLINLGFLAHCEKLRKAGQEQVFPEVEVPETGQIAAQFSREFNRYMGRIGIKTDRSIVTYSLRHTFVDKARLAGFLDNEIAMVVGHETGEKGAKMTAGYGVLQEGTLKRRSEIIEAINYPCF